MLVVWGYPTACEYFSRKKMPQQSCCTVDCYASSTGQESWSGWNCLPTDQDSPVPAGFASRPRLAIFRHPSQVLGSSSLPNMLWFPRKSGKKKRQFLANILKWKLSRFEIWCTFKIHILKHVVLAFSDDSMVAKNESSGKIYTLFTILECKFICRLSWIIFITLDFWTLNNVQVSKSYNFCLS